MKVSLKGLPEEPRGVAWPSPARTVRRPVKSGNERDPRPQLVPSATALGHSGGTAAAKAEEGAGDGRSVYMTGFHSKYWLFGLIQGDGNVEKNRITITTSSYHFAKIVTKIAKSAEVEATIHLDRKKRCYKVRLRDKKILAILKKNKFTVSFLKNSNLFQKLSYVAGLFDAEGWFERYRNNTRIRIKMKEKKIIFRIRDILKEINIHSVCFTKDNCYLLQIERDESIEIFLSSIPLQHPKWRPVMAEGPNPPGNTRPTKRATMGCDPERGS